MTRTCALNLFPTSQPEIVAGCAHAPASQFATAGAFALAALDHPQFVEMNRGGAP